MVAFDPRASKHNAEMFEGEGVHFGVCGFKDGDVGLSTLLNHMVSPVSYTHLTLPTMLWV